MFDFFRKHMRVLQFVLVLLIVPSFVFFGIQGYSGFSEGGNTTVARGRRPVGHAGRVGHGASRPGRAAAPPDAQRRPGAARQRRGEAPRRSTSCCATACSSPPPTTCTWRPPTSGCSGCSSPIRSSPSCATRTARVNRDVLAAQGLSSEGFASRLRQDLSKRQVLLGVAGSSLAAPDDRGGRARPAAAAARGAAAALRAEGLRRQGDGDRRGDRSATTTIRPTPTAFMAPEQATIEYVVLDLAALARDIKVSDDELRRYYAENIARYTVAEERRASHILVKAEKGAPAAERAKAKAKAEALLAEVRRDPAGVRRAGAQELRRPRLGGEGRRPRLLRPRRDGQAVRGRGLRAQARRDQRRWSRATSATTSSGSTRCAAARSAASSRCAPSWRKRCGASSRRSAMPRPRSTSPTWSTSSPRASSRWPTSSSSRCAPRRACGARRPPVRAARSPRRSSSRRCSRATRCATSATPRRSRPLPTSSSPAASSQYAPARRQPLAEVRDTVRAAVVASLAAEEARKAGTARLAELRKAPQTPLDAPKLTVSRAQPRELPKPLLDARARCRCDDAAGRRRRRPRPRRLCGGAHRTRARPRPGCRRPEAAAGAVRAGLGHGRGARLLRRAEAPFQGRGEAAGDGRRRRLVARRRRRRSSCPMRGSAAGLPDPAAPGAIRRRILPSSRRWL